MSSLKLAVWATFIQLIGYWPKQRNMLEVSRRCAIAAENVHKGGCQNLHSLFASDFEYTNLPKAIIAYAKA